MRNCVGVTSPRVTHRRHRLILWKAIASASSIFEFICRGCFCHFVDAVSQAELDSVSKATDFTIAPTISSAATKGSGDNTPQVPINY